MATADNFSHEGNGKRQQGHNQYILPASKLSFLWAAFERSKRNEDLECVFLREYLSRDKASQPPKKWVFLLIFRNANGNLFWVLSWGREFSLTLTCLRHRTSLACLCTRAWMLSLPRQHLYILCMFEVHRSALTGLRRLDIWPNTNSLPNAFKLCGQVFLPAVQSACLSCIDCAWVVLFYAVVWSCSPRSTTVWLSSVAWLREAVENPSRTWAPNGRRFRRFKASGFQWSRGVPRWWERYGKVTWDGPWSPRVGRQKRNRLQRELMRRRWRSLEYSRMINWRPLTHVDPCWTYLMTWSDLKWLEMTMILWYFMIF